MLPLTILLGVSYLAIGNAVIYEYVDVFFLGLLKVPINVKTFMNPSTRAAVLTSKLKSLLQGRMFNSSRDSIRWLLERDIGKSW